MAVFGEVVTLRDELNWFEDRPLSGKRIVVTRTRTQAGALSEQLRALGADVIELPTIRIEPPTDLRAFAELVQDAHAYDWIVFTSPNGVTAFFDLFYKLYDDAREIGGARIAAIGPATAQRIKDFHLHVDLQPEEFVAEALVREFRKEGGVENLRILLARAEKARDLLPKELSALGAIVDEGFAYRTVPETRDDSGARRRLLEEGADLITFTSSSTVENFLALGLPWPAKMQVASIGPVTSKTARDRGLDVAVEARRHDIPGLVDAVRKFFSDTMKSPMEIKITDEFASAMQQLSAEAEKILPENDSGRPAGQRAVRADSEGEFRVLNGRMTSFEEAVLGRLEKLENAEKNDFAEQLRRMDEHMVALRNTESVNQRLFDSLHQELIKYRDNFLHESLQKPFIRDLVILFDDLSGLLSAAPDRRGGERRQARQARAMAG